MFTSRNAKRFMAVGIALAITFMTNFAISYAAKNSADHQEAVQFESGSPTIPDPPLPRSGSPTIPDPPQP